MCKKVIINVGEVSNDNLVTYIPIEKFKKNIKIKVDASHKVVVFKDFVINNVLPMGEHTPFVKDDKNYKIILAYVNTSKSISFSFATRLTQIKDKVNSNIYTANFLGDYSFSVRNERKFLGTSILSKSNFSQTDFASLIENEVNSSILSFVIDYFSTNNISFKDFSKYIEKAESFVLNALNKYLDDTYGIEVRSLKLTKMNIENIMKI